MKPARVDTKQKLEALVQRMRDQERRVRLVETGEAATQPAAAPPAGQAPAQAPVGTAATTPEPLEKKTTNTTDVTVDSIVQQLNTLRAGKSLKDSAVQGELSRYFEGLESSEQEALHAYLKGLAQIVSGQIDAGQAEDPGNHGVETKITNKKTRQIKPNVVKKSASKPAAPGAAGLGAPKEDTTPPSAGPIIPKKR